MKEAKVLTRHQRNQHNRRRLAGFTLAWLLSLALIYFGHRFVWDGDKLITGVMGAINLLLGAGMMWANKIMLNGLDELEQKIQLEAMGLSLGVGLVGGFAYSALAKTGVLPFAAEISHLAVLMALTYLAGTYRGVKKYQ
ncbi:hypothetical protein [Alteromonas lipolytica]|uniref:Uncharacterized protein n=1 Tax=Alteromonas lipolytica TaxID=1856405 RepID=A0A1E8F8B9_9ALTE|nr:hypothetical protein [Alteromonas lipolytica]OFI32169.1 hypothetical protein BFC17_08045 [Alteromonas lipolytica]